MNLDNTLILIENQVLVTDIGTLSSLAAEDEIGGYHPDATQAKWPVGSVFEVEGQTLYALIRALQPRNVVEIGLQDGCSATHIAAALRANGAGKLTSVDRGNSGPLIPGGLRPFIAITGGDGVEWLTAQPDNSIDFLFEDADHSEDLAYNVGVLAQTKLRLGGVFVAHDAAHFLVGADIRAGYTRAGMDYQVYSIEPSDCGLLLWKRPGTWVQEVDVQAEVEAVEEVVETPEPEVVKITPKKKAPARKVVAKGKAAK